MNTGEERLAVEGVRIVVSQDGSEIGEARSDADGKWSVPVPGAGSYSVELDVTTLPEGVALTDPERGTLPEVDVQEGRPKVVLFPLGEGTSTSTSTYARVGSLFVSGLKLGAVIALSAVGLSLIYRRDGPRELRPRRNGHPRCRAGVLLPHVGCRPRVAARGRCDTGNRSRSGIRVGTGSRIVATVAKTRDGPDLDDGRIDRPRIRHPTRHPGGVRWQSAPVP